MKKIIFGLMVMLGLGQQNCYSQAGNWLWARQATGGYTEDPSAIAKDVFGNIYVTGGFLDSTITFDSITLTNAGSWDMFITKFDANGNVIWANSVGGSDREYGSSVATDALGNVYVTGVFDSSTLVFNLIFGGPTILTNSGGDDIFVVKYNASGNAIWAKQAGSNSYDVSTSVTTDVSGGIYITGKFNSPTITFDTITLTKSGTATNMFIVKYNVNGNVIWAENVTGGYSAGNSITADSSGIYVTGYINGLLLNFDTIAFVGLGTGISGTDVFVAKYDVNGNAIWVRRGAGSSYEIGNSVTTDASSNVYVTGYYGGYRTIFETDTLTCSGANYKMFIVKYDSNGNEIWAKCATPSNNNVIGLCVSTDFSGIYVTGQFTGLNAVFDTDTIFYPTGAFDPMFFIKYDFNGNTICLTMLPSGGDDICAIAPDGMGNVYLAGDFAGINPFILGTDSLILTGLETFFLAKYNCEGESVGINQATMNEIISIYPNPVTTILTLRQAQGTGEGRVTIYNVMGEKMMEGVMRGEKKEMDVGFLGKGIYFVRVESEKGVWNGRFVKG